MNVRVLFTCHALQTFPWQRNYGFVRSTLPLFVSLCLRVFLLDHNKLDCRPHKYL